jgi:ABC-type transporter Mla subunit MlaD
MLDDVTAVADDTRALVDRAAPVADDAAALVGRAATVAEGAAGALARAEEVSGSAAGVLERAEAAARDAEELLARVVPITGAAEAVLESVSATGHGARALLDTVSPLAERGVPLLRHLVDEFSATEVHALVRLVDQLPRFTEHMEDDIMPILATLDRVGPDVHELLDVLKDVRLAIQGVPGFRLLRRRGADRDDEPAGLPDS